MSARRALITGSSRGIGRAIALRLAAEGAHVSIHYAEREDAARATLEAVRAAGGDGRIVGADLTDEDDTRRLFDDLDALDVVVHGARPELAHFYEPPLSLSTAAWAAAIDSQARAFLLGAQACGRVMRDGGRIVALTYAPGARLGSWRPWSAMGPAKAALDALVRYFAVALAPRAITVNSVSPGWAFGEPGTLDGTVVDGLPAEFRETLREWHEQGWTPMRRVGTPADVADAVMLLLDERARFVTGQTLHADGGASLMDPLAPLPAQGL